MGEFFQNLKKANEQKDQLLGQNACALFGIEPATRKQIRGM